MYKSKALVRSKTCFVYRDEIPYRNLNLTGSEGNDEKRREFWRKEINRNIYNKILKKFTYKNTIEPHGKLEWWLVGTGGRGDEMLPCTPIRLCTVSLADKQIMPLGLVQLSQQLHTTLFVLYMLENGRVQSRLKSPKYIQELYNTIRQSFKTCALI